MLNVPSRKNHMIANLLMNCEYTVSVTSLSSQDSTFSYKILCLLKVNTQVPQRTQIYNLYTKVSIQFQRQPKFVF